MGRLIDMIEARIAELGHLKALALGVCLGAVSGGLTYVTASAVPFGVSFLAYFPFHAWLVISLFLVIFSLHERQKYVGPNRSFVGAFFARIFSPYGLFCLGWFYLLVAGGSSLKGTLAGASSLVSTSG